MRGLINPAQSVKARLLQRAQARGEDYQRLLTSYGIERLLYRLSQSPHGGQFVLKGATLFTLWEALPFRPTRDLDLLGYGSDDGERIHAVFVDLCELDVPPDGLVYAAESIRVEPIREGSRYHGQRAKLRATLERTHVDLQVDIGFGDAVVPPPDEVDFPTLLGHPAPRLRAYRRETVIAEKLHALVDHGLASSRVKDLVDLWVLGQRYAFDGGALVSSVAAAFERRGTEVPVQPVALTDEFSGDATQQSLWAGFVRRTHMSENPPPLADVIVFLRGFLSPVLAAAREGGALEGSWPPGGPWN